MEEPREPAVVTCSLGPEDHSARRTRWQQVRARALIEAVGRQDGVRLIFRNDPDVEQDLRQLVALEGECCSFADWAFHGQDGKLILDIRADGDAAAFVREMLSGQ